MEEADMSGSKTDVDGTVTLTAVEEVTDSIRVTLVTDDGKDIEDIVALEVETVDKLVASTDGRPSTETIVGDADEDIVLAADAEVKLAAAEDMVDSVPLTATEDKEDVIDSEIDAVVIVVPDGEVLKDDNVESIILVFEVLTSAGIVDAVMLTDEMEDTGIEDVVSVSMLVADMVALDCKVDPENKVSGIDVDIVPTTVEVPINDATMLVADAEVKLAAAEDMVVSVPLTATEDKEDVIDSEIDAVVILVPDTEVLKDDNVESIILVFEVLTSAGIVDAVMLTDEMEDTGIEDVVSVSMLVADMVALDCKVDTENKVSGINVDIVPTTVELPRDVKLSGDGDVEEIDMDDGVTPSTAVTIVAVNDVEVALTAIKDVKGTDVAVAKISADVTFIDDSGVDSEVTDTAGDVEVKAPVPIDSDVLVLPAETDVVVVELPVNASDEV